MGHGKIPRWNTRQTECPAYGKKCGTCGRQNHIDKVCLGGRRPAKPPSEATNEIYSEQTAAFVEPCTVSTDNNSDEPHTLPLAHHLYDNMSDRWLQRRSSPQPYVTLTLTNEREDYQALGFDLRKSTRKVTLPAMADTGCQSCLIGLEVAQQMGLTTDDLIPVSMTMRAANRTGIRILGAVVVRITGDCDDGRSLKSARLHMWRTARPASSYPMQHVWIWVWSLTSSPHLGRLSWQPLNVTAPDVHSRQPSRPHFPCQRPTPTERHSKNTCSNCMPIAHSTHAHTNRCHT